MERETVIKIENLSKTFSIRDNSSNTIREKVFTFFRKTKKRKIEALKNINLEVKKGDFIGLIGRNGSGKSTLINVILGTYPPDKGGTLEVNGHMVRLALAKGFNGQLTARENIYINGSVLGLTFKEIDAVFDDIIEFSELQDFVDTKIKFYSSGMRSRLAFAIALHARADIFLMDEFFGGVGDAIFKRKSDMVFQESFLEGRTIIFVSHGMENIRKYCNKVLLLDKGVPVALGTPDEVLGKYEEVVNKGKKNK